MAESGKLGPGGWGGVEATPPSMHSQTAEARAVLRAPHEPGVLLVLYWYVVGTGMDS